MERNIFKGQIYYAAMPARPGCVQNGNRPVVIVSNNIGNVNSEIVLVAPITSRAKPHIPTHFEILLPKILGTVLCEQITVLDKACLGDYAGCLSRYYMNLLDSAIMKAFNLDGTQGTNIPPEEDEVISEQRKRCEELREAYLQEVIMFSKMVGYAKTEMPMGKVPDVKEVSEQPDAPTTKKKYNRRTQGEIESFIAEWEDPESDLKEVARVYGFSSKTIAQMFYKRHKEKVS